MHRYTVSSMWVCSVTYALVCSLTPSSLSLSNSHLHRQMWIADMHRYTVSSMWVCSVTYALVCSLTPSSLSLSNSHLYRQMWIADMRRYALSNLIHVVLTTLPPPMVVPLPLHRGGYQSLRLAKRQATSLCTKEAK